MIQNFCKNLDKIDGVEVAVTNCGLKKSGKDDLVLIKFSKKSKIIGCFTDSKTPGEPIKWNKSIIGYGKVSAILINSGNANVFNGKQGLTAQKKILSSLSKALKVDPKEIYLASTGIIGEILDEKKIINSIPKLISNLQNDEAIWIKAANAIKTTDTFPKLTSKLLNIEQKKIYINGIAKGSGMIEPNMATMLAFIFTNANLNKIYFKKKIREIVDKTFNSISVDGEKSTSDMMLFISVESENMFFVSKKQLVPFFENLESVMQELAIQIVKDGEGSKKLIEVNVKGTRNDKEAKVIAKLIANSVLFKTAMSGNDGNWGRVVMAIGKTNLNINLEKISLKFGDIQILTNGKKNKNPNYKDLDKYLKKQSIKLHIDLGIGNGSSKIWTCDLTKKYVSINADYRS